jgi:hypothetical protein
MNHFLREDRTIRWQISTAGKPSQLLVLGSASLLASFPQLGHDLAVKLLVGRPKDLARVATLHQSGLINSETLRARMDLREIPLERRPQLLENCLNTIR